MWTSNVIQTFGVVTYPVHLRTSCVTWRAPSREWCGLSVLVASVTFASGNVSQLWPVSCHRRRWWRHVRCLRRGDLDAATALPGPQAHCHIPDTGPWTVETVLFPKGKWFFTLPILLMLLLHAFESIPFPNTRCGRPLCDPVTAWLWGHYHTTEQNVLCPQ